MFDLSFPLTDVTQRSCPSSYRSNSWKNLMIEEPRGLPDEFFNFEVGAFTPNHNYTMDSERMSSCRVGNDSFFRIPRSDIVVVKRELPSLTESSESSEDSDSDIVMAPSTVFINHRDNNNVSIKDGKILETKLKHEPLVFRMEKFPPDKVGDFKHVIYNVLVDGYNSGSPVNWAILPCEIEIDGTKRIGFQFNNGIDPDKKIPELYGFHIHQCKLEHENQNSPFIQDLYKFYLRAGVELLGKYFEKIGKYTFLYDEQLPLFVPGGNLREAEQRIKRMRTRARKNSTQTTSEGINGYGPYKKRKGTSRKIPYAVKCGIHKS